MGKRRGRPRLEQQNVIVEVYLRLKPGQDNDLIEFFATIPPGMRVATVKSALRSGGMRQELDAINEQADEELAEFTGNVLL